MSNRPLFLDYAFFKEFAKLAKSVFGDEVQVWYTERNGDGIGCVMPKGSQATDLPCFAKGYVVFEWIHPDEDFGSGIKPTRLEKNDYGSESIGAHHIA